MHAPDAFGVMANEVGSESVNVAMAVGPLVIEKFPQARKGPSVQVALGRLCGLDFHRAQHCLKLALVQQDINERSARGQRMFARNSGLERQRRCARPGSLAEVCAGLLRKQF